MQESGITGERRDKFGEAKRLGQKEDSQSRGYHQGEETSPETDLKSRLCDALSFAQRSTAICFVLQADCVHWCMGT